MRDRDVGALPVLDGGTNPIGVLTDRDIAIRVVAEGSRRDLPAADDTTGIATAVRQ